MSGSYDTYLLISTIILLLWPVVLITKNPLRSSIVYILLAYPFISFYLPPRRYAIYALFSLLVLLPVFLRFFSARKLHYSGPSNLSKYLAIMFLGIAAISSFLGKNPTLYVLVTLSFGFYFLFYWFVRSNLFTPEDLVETLTNFFLVMVSLNAIFTVGQILIGPSFSFYAELINPNIYAWWEMSRYPGLFNDPLKSAWFSSVAGTILLGNALLEKKTHRKLISAAVVLICISVVLLTGSRAAGLSLFAGIALLLLLQRGKGWTSRAAMAALIPAIVIGLGGLTGVFNVFFERMGAIQEGGLFRLSVWERSWRLVLESPAIGHGFGSYYDIVRNYDIYSSAQYSIHEWAESGFMYLLVEVGVLGLAAFAGFVVYHIWRAFVPSKPRNSGLCAAHARYYGIGIIVWMANFMILDPFSDIRIVVLLFLLLGGVCVLRQEEI